jgi:hypothetical protein
MLIAINFTPVLVMPTRITANLASLIDHVYYVDGMGEKHSAIVKSGNILEDITDHPPGYVLIIRKARQCNIPRPMVKIFSSQNINNAVDRLEATDWSPITNEVDVNISFNMFTNILYSAYDESFRLVKLSRRRSNDKKWVTSAL